MNVNWHNVNSSHSSFISVVSALVVLCPILSTWHQRRAEAEYCF